MKDQNYIKAMQSYMLENNVNQEELAKRLKVTPGALVHWLSGHNGITRYNKEKIKILCGKWLTAPDIPGTDPEEVLTLVNSVGRVTIAERDSDPVKIAIERFRDAITQQLFLVEMPAALRNHLVKIIQTTEVNLEKK